MPSNLDIYSFDQLGAFGLNTQEAAVVLSGQWASVADNVEFDNEGVLKPRPCIVDFVSQPSAGTIYSLHAYKWVNTSNTLFQQIYVTYASTTEVASDIAGSFSNSAMGTGSTNDYKYASVRLGDRIFFFARGARPQTANIAVAATVGNVTDAAAPTAHIVCSAFGRLWSADTGDGSANKRTLYWSVLLDGNDWSGVGSGSLDLTSVWGTTDDEITAIKEFNNCLIVFSLKRITILGNPQATTFSNTSFETGGAIYVKDMIVGTGCIYRDAAVNIGDDIAFLDYSGMYVLSRVIQEKSNPLTQLAPHIQDTLRDVALIGRQTAIQSPDGRQTKLLYNQNTKQLYLFTNGSNHYVFHMNRRLENGGVCVTRWTGFTVEDAALYTANDGNVYVLFYGAWTNSGGNKVGFLYSPYLLSVPSSGSNRETFTATITTTWDVLNKPVQKKMLKRALVTYQGASITYTLSFSYDFQTTNQQTFTFPAASGGGYKVASVPIGGSGETVMMTVSWPVTYTTTSYRINRIVLQFKGGRLSAGI